MDGIPGRGNPLCQPSGHVTDIFLGAAHGGGAAGQVVLQVIGVFRHLELCVGDAGDISHGIVGIGRSAVHGVGHGHQVVQQVVAVPGDRAAGGILVFYKPGIQLKLNS